jgi:hypothetical protein
MSSTDPPNDVAKERSVHPESTQQQATTDQPLWALIRCSTDALSFQAYEEFIDELLCGPQASERGKEETRDGGFELRLPFPDVHAYRLLKAATELFVMQRCDVRLSGDTNIDQDVYDYKDNAARLGLDLGDEPAEKVLERLFRAYLEKVEFDDGKTLLLIPYLARLRANLLPMPRRDPKTEQVAELCEHLIEERFTRPCLIELIWSFWHEQGLLAETMQAISVRFQNERGGADHDPLAELEISYLRPLNNLLWGYIQDEQHRLTPQRRAYEYDHQYGLRLNGAVGSLQPVDSRSRFLQAFDDLLRKTALFYTHADATTAADAFPVLNAIRDVHLLLSEGAHNQFGDLPRTARQEMLMEQWLLARPEFDELLPTRRSVVFREPWMSRVEAMRRLQGWGETSIRHYRNLAVYGEQLLLSIRYGNWSEVTNPDQAANWARFWRQEVQGYIHAYQTVRGVDLSRQA